MARTGIGRSRFTHWVFVGAAVTALVIILSGPLVRFDLAGFGTVFGYLPYAVMAAGAIAVLALIAIIRDARARRGAGKAVMAFLIAALPALFMLNIARTARNVPPIHDISTDTDDPPEFAAILPLRADAPNAPEYNREFTDQQKKAYPDLSPLELREDPDDVYAEALDAVEDRGWDIVEADQASGHIEATETTTWFGFKDDVVIRIRPLGGTGSVVDVRSKSRMGMSDLGANAQRIRSLLADIEDG
ncbi:MAG: DUF1499 domain-containing protein [Pacificimonas sp.]